MTGSLKHLCVGLAAMLALGVAAEAQWSIGAPGNRLAQAGPNRYAFLVMTNPIPGREAEFNDWYQNVHMGDLVQLPGWYGAQRFRLVTGITPPGPMDSQKYGYLIIWDQEGSDAAALEAEVGAAIRGGKSRRGGAFNYTPGATLDATYQVIGARVVRPDGKGPFIPDAADNATPRPNRYILMDYSDPARGVKDSDYEAALTRRVGQVLAVSGWMAAQEFRLVPPAKLRPGLTALPKFLVLWEIEGQSAQAAQDALSAAIAAGSVSAVKADPATARAVYWQPISPYITKDQFER